jgi:hypothetical protein
MQIITCYYLMSHVVFFSSTYFELHRPATSENRVLLIDTEICRRQTNSGHVSIF